MEYLAKEGLIDREQEKTNATIWSKGAGSVQGYVLAHRQNPVHPFTK